MAVSKQKDCSAARCPGVLLPSLQLAALPLALLSLVLASASVQTTECCATYRNSNLVCLGQGAGGRGDCAGSSTKACSIGARPESSTCQPTLLSNADSVSLLGIMKTAMTMASAVATAWPQKHNKLGSRQFSDRMEAAMACHMHAHAQVPQDRASR